MLPASARTVSAFTGVAGLGADLSSETLRSWLNAALMRRGLLPMAMFMAIRSKSTSGLPNPPHVHAHPVPGEVAEGGGGLVVAVAVELHCQAGLVDHLR